MARRYRTSAARRTAQKRYRRDRRRYEDYLMKFEARKESFEKRGLTFYDDVPLTFRDYKTVRAEKSNDLRADIAEGKRKGMGDVNREIVSDQAYELSSRQADVLANYLLENNMDDLEKQGLIFRTVDESGNERVNLKKKIELYMKIRQGEFLKDDIGIWDMIKDFRAELYKKGMKPEDVAKQVGITFFNSPE